MKNIIPAPLATLSYALRHPETWPPAFGPWNFLDRDRCAMGLACHLGLAATPYGREMMATFNLTEREATEIFYTGLPSPAKVADRIDMHINN